MELKTCKEKIMQDKLLSIVIPAYNAEEYLLETIPTILDSKNIDLIDVMIVNDGSIDNTEQLANSFVEQFPQSVRVINKVNGGHGSAVNTGINYAVGKYFKIVDADDWVDTNNLDLLIEYLKNTNVDEILTPYYQVFVNEEDKLETEYNEFKKVQENQIYAADSFFNLTKQTVGMHTITIKTEILKNNGIELSEKMFYVDMEFITKILPFVKNMVYLNYPVYKYRLGTSGQSVSIESYIKNRMMHKQVILNLVEFYTNTEMSNVKKRVFQKLLFNLIRMQCIIYFNIENTIESKNELINFETELKKINSDVLKDKNLKMIMLRKSNYHLFNLMKWYYNRRKNEKNY